MHSYSCTNANLLGSQELDPTACAASVPWVEIWLDGQAQGVRGNGATSRGVPRVQDWGQGSEISSLLI